MGNLIVANQKRSVEVSPAPALLDVELEAPAPTLTPSDAYYHSLIQLSFTAKIQFGEFIDIPRSNLLLGVFKGKIDEAAIEIGRTATEVFEDKSEANISWSNKIIVNYCFGDSQPLILRLYHVNPENQSTLVTDLVLHEQELLAESSIVLSEIAIKMESTCTLGLVKKQTRQQIGTLTIKAEETMESRGLSLRIKISTHLNKTSGISKKGQYLMIYRRAAKGTAKAICTTELKSEPNPEWNVYLTMQQIGCKDDELVIEGFNICSNGNHTSIGTWQAPVSEMEKPHCEKSVRGLEKIRSGQLSVDMLEIHSFLDYINHGYELGLMVAVDFAATYVDPESLNTLHNIDPSGNLNAYEQILKDIGMAIEDFDSDRRFPAWGIGGKTNEIMTPCFNLDVDSSNCVVRGVEGILDAYRSALAKVTFHCPASLSEVIQKASDFAVESCTYNRRKYYVLLMITNGDLIGVQETVDSVVKASYLPLSILIFGIGDGKKFEKMKKLCPGHLLKDSKGVSALRDIVCFVPKCNASADERFISCLEEIPKQFLTYMRKKGIKPCSI